MACERHESYEDHMCQIVKLMKVNTRRHTSKEVLYCLYFFVEYLEFVFELVIVFVIVNMQGHIVESTFQLAYAEFWRHMQEMCEIYSLQYPIGCPACSPSPRAVHLDGNMKLYTHDHGYEMCTQPKPYVRMLFGDDINVLAHVEKTDQATKQKVRSHNASKFPK
jgi:hypothetical protein